MQDEAKSPKVVQYLTDVVGGLEFTKQAAELSAVDKTN